MAYKGLSFTAAASPDQPFIIDIEGYIGYEPWDPPAGIISTKEQMRAELKTLAAIKADKALVRINTLGGDVAHALSIHDLLKVNFKEITVEISGATASSGTIIAMAGTIRRQSDNSLILIHRASNWAGGNVNVMTAMAEDLRKWDNLIINIYVKATGKSLEEITALMDEDNGNGKWLLPEEAKAAGLITDIFEPTYKAAASANSGRTATNAMLTRYGLPLLPTNNTINPDEDETQHPKNIFRTVKKMIENALIQFIPDTTDGCHHPNVDNTTTPPTGSPNPPNIPMKQFPNLNKSLGVENLASSDNKGVYLNEAQMETLSTTLQTALDATDAANTLAATEKTTTDATLATATAEKDTAVATLATATAEKDTAVATLATAEAAVTTALANLDEVDPTVKAAVDLSAKLQAVKAYAASRPGVPAPGTQGTKDPEGTPADGVDHKVLDELPHQKEARAMFGD